MVDLPSGTVTFLFTDIEGSTKLWEQYPDAMRGAQAQHEALLRTAIESHHGYVFKLIGDAFCAAFATATDGLTAILAIQRGLATAAWGETGPLRVRAALHTGAVESRSGDYFGHTLSRVARILSAGAGGQTLLSATAAPLVQDSLPAGLSLRDLGAHRLKSLTFPEHIFQLVVPDLRSDFPPLTTLDARPTNLPAQPTALIGREREVDEVCAMLRRPALRLLTLIGPGGSGKTRLALQVAAEMLDAFTDGVFLVALAPISDPGQVATTVAHALGVTEAQGRTLSERLTEYLRDKQILLLLDNFEQIVAAAPLVGELLAAAPQLKVLITSRVVVHLYGEHAFTVPPLTLPDPVRLPPFEHLNQYEAVRLFIERAQAVKSDFAVTNANAPAVAAICQRLDGLPLAIELAAARITLFPPQALLARLDNRLKLLTGGARDLPHRQQTIRGAIDWSYQLLDAGEQMLFKRLGVFVGGWTIDAAEAICNATGDLPLESVDGLSALVDKSLVKQIDGMDGEPRFIMLETIREFALDQLATSGELELLRQQHATFFVTLAEATEQKDSLEIELPNFRAALVWSRTEADGTSGLRLVLALDWLWGHAGYLSEGRGWLTEVVAVRAGHTSESESIPYRTLRARAFARLGIMAQWQNDLAAAQAALEQGVAALRELGDTKALADALADLGWIVGQRGDYAQSGALLEESLELSRQLQDINNIAWCFFYMGTLAYFQGYLTRASELLEEGLTIYRPFGQGWVLTSLLLNLGLVALDQDELGRAGVYLAECLTRLREMGERSQVLRAVELCAGLAAARNPQGADPQGAGRRAARILGAAEALRETLGFPLMTSNLDYHGRTMVATQALLDDATFTAAWNAGRELTLDEAISEALAVATEQ